MKKVYLASKRGFCSGVERALQKVEDALKKGPFPVYVLHEIVHNETIVESLRNRGVHFVDHPSEAGAAGTLILSAHGVSQAVERETECLACQVIDAACPIVKSLHRTIGQFASEGRKILLFGRKGHREVEGLVGRVPEASVTVIESEAALTEYLAHADRNQKYACLSQTTFDSEKLIRMSAMVKESLPETKIAAEVCFATRDRQHSAANLAKHCELVIVVGSGNSSNSRRLCEIAQSHGSRAVLLSRAEHFSPELLEDAETVGITSGASAPEAIVQSVLGKMQKLGYEYSGEL